MPSRPPGAPLRTGRRYVDLQAKCRSCMRMRNVDLQALVDAGKGDVPLIHRRFRLQLLRTSRLRCSGGAEGTRAGAARMKRIVICTHRYKRRSAALVALAALAPIAGAPSFAADQERHVVSGTDLNGPPPECLKWPYPAY